MGEGITGRTEEPFPAPVEVALGEGITGQTKEPFSASEGVSRWTEAPSVGPIEVALGEGITGRTEEHFPAPGSTFAGFFRDRIAETVERTLLGTIRAMKGRELNVTAATPLG